MKRSTVKTIRMVLITTVIVVGLVLVAYIANPGDWVSHLPEALQKAPTVTGTPSSAVLPE